MDAYEEHYLAVNSDQNNRAAQIMLSKLDPTTVKLFKSVRDRATRLAESQLQRGMFRVISGNYTQIAADLIDTNRWLSHGQMISHDDATDIGLIVSYLNRGSRDWKKFWSLYCHQRLALKDAQKLFESEIVSVRFDS